MVHYYLDIETYGTGEKPNPATDKIIAILFCAIDPKTGKQVQRPIILKEWESSEETIVKAFSARFLAKRSFDFTPVGFNVPFDFWFLTEKFRKHCGKNVGFDLFVDKPHIDLKHVAVLANGGTFKGVSLSGEGKNVKSLYEKKDWTAIEKHMTDKLERFLAAYATWAAVLQE